MLVFDFFAFLVAAVCFFLTTIGVTARFNLLALGLFAWVLVPLVHTASALF